jgi:hypothetical protein
MEEKDEGGEMKDAGGRRKIEITPRGVSSFILSPANTP